MKVRLTAGERERLKIVAYVRERGLAAERAAKRSALCTDEEARLLGRRIAAIADEIERGLHL